MTKNMQHCELGESASKIIKYAKNHIVPECEFYSSKPTNIARLRWFFEYFAFLDNKRFQHVLARAFYQARFLYKISMALNLQKVERLAVIKYQLIQYVSICEAMLNYTLERYFEKEKPKNPEYCSIMENVSGLLKVTYNNMDVFLCRSVTKSKSWHFIRTQDKTQILLSNNIINDEAKTQFDRLYDLRNRVHLYKEYQDECNGEISAMQRTDDELLIEHSKEAFDFMMKFTESLKKYYEGNPLSK